MLDAGIKIPGPPKAQPRHRYRRQGRKIISYDPASSDKKKVRLVIASEWSKAPLKGAISMIITFYCERPKSHYRTGRYSNVLKEDAPVVKTTKPDVDNYVKFYMDCGKDILWGDDAQVVRIEAWKVYIDMDGPRTEMEIWEME
tara:strand:- start:454 stop:882 length:429 start_codon:yes stop_codon:yes gene_type:complete